MATILEQIVRTKETEVAAAWQARPLAELQATLRTMPPPRDFYVAVTAPRDDVRLIAEIKKSSPSAGLIRADFDPAAIARTYERHGAAALSVLTDRTYFSGDLSFLQVVKDVVALPVLRKDFIIEEYQVFESRAAGADAILLIAGILSVEMMERFARLAFELGMASLVEIHDEQQLDAVRGIVGPTRRAILGINNRDLHSQRTDSQTSVRLARLLPPGTPFVSESGIRTRADVLALKDAGAKALLIGETFMRAADIGAKVDELMSRV